MKRGGKRSRLVGEGTLASPMLEGVRRTREQDEGDASVPSHHIRPSRPYWNEAASEATS